jgi:tetratricopeptide (TPR) repeat protein
VTDDAMSTLEKARAAFKSGDYAQALSVCDQVLTKMPNDRAIHEFRGVVLFALKRYDDAAAALYAVLSAGPGWDWTTMAGLYPSTDVYTDQLRALESYSRQNPDSAAARFVLGYLYAVQGDNETASAEFQRVAKLQPNDSLAPKLAKMFAKTDQASTPATVPVDIMSAPSYSMVGTWIARSTQDMAIALTISEGGSFTWKVTTKDQTRELTGKSTYANGQLTLQEKKEGPSLVGQVTWQDDKHFTFQVAGGGALDPGLKFSR